MIFTMAVAERRLPVLRLVMPAGICIITMTREALLMTDTILAAPRKWTRETPVEMGIETIPKQAALMTSRMTTRGQDTPVDDMLASADWIVILSAEGAKTKESLVMTTAVDLACTRPVDARRGLVSMSWTATTIRAARREIAKMTRAGARTVLRGETRRARTGTRGGLTGRPDAICLTTAEEAWQGTAGKRTRVRGTAPGRAVAAERPATSMITEHGTEEGDGTTCAAGRKIPPIRTATTMTTTATGRSGATGAQVVVRRRGAATIKTTTTATGAWSRTQAAAPLAAVLRAYHATIRATQTRGSTHALQPCVLLLCVACPRSRARMAARASRHPTPRLLTWRLALPDAARATGSASSCGI